MILQVCTVYDVKARAYLPPIFTATVDVALRAFSNAANDPAQNIGRNPEDYIMFHVGSWNDDNAQFLLMKEPENIGLAANFKERRV